MPRPKKGEPGHTEAIAKWRRTMQEKYGGEAEIRRQMQQIGAVGGQHGKTGGFYGHPERARIAGAKGGRISRRGPGSVVATKIIPQAKKIEDLYYKGYSIPKIAELLDLPYGSLLRWAKTDLVGYGAADDIERYEKMLEHESGRH